MAKGKKRKAPMAAQDRKREEPANLFERISNKKRFNILGRKFKGDTRQVGKLRSEATERRKDTLLVEYRQLRKSNAFIDRRFGEDDESLTADEKALLRFQKQRMKEVSGSKFTLADDDGEGGGGGEQLTHMGRSLAELEDIEEGWGSDDDGDGGLGDELVRDHHFGGGLFERKEGGGEGEDDEEGRAPKKTKKEVMEEIIAKSKSFKAEKQRQREEDADETTALDDQFRSLLGDKALLGLMRKKGEKPDRRADNKEDAAFDVLTRELVFEAKARPGGRTLTAEELAELERQRLEVLEAQRRRRMQGEGPEEDEEGEEGDEGGEGAGRQQGAAGELPAGGYAARRAKRARAEDWDERLGGGGASGDALEDDFALGSSDDGSGDGSEDFSGSEDEEQEGSDKDQPQQGVGHGGRQLTKLELRRQARAAGAHPLQEAFREAAARLLKRHRKGGDGKGSEEEEEGEEEEGGSSSEEEGQEEGDGGGASGSEEEEKGGDSDSGSEDASADSQEEEEEEEEELAVADLKASSAGPAANGVSSGDDSGASSSEEEEEEEAGAAAVAAANVRPSSKGRAAAAPAAKPAAAAAAVGELPPGVSPDLPYTPPLPTSYAEFAQLAEGRSAADLAELVRRLRVVHAPTLNSGARKGLQLLYGTLVQHFASLVGRAGGALPLEHLDALVPHLVELTPQVPFYAATLARARLLKAQARLTECLRDPELRVDAWPAPRVLLLLKLFATVFPASDKRHPVLTPAGLLVCSCLSNCPVTKPQHVATGLYLASLAVHLHSQAKRYVPEPLCFAVLALQGVLPPGVYPSASAAGRSHQRQLAAEDPRWLAIAATDAGVAYLPVTAEGIEALDIVQVLSSSSGAASDEYWASAAFKTSAAAAAVRLVGRCTELLAGNVALPEVLAPAQEVLRSIVAAAEVQPAAAAVQPGEAQQQQKKQKKKKKGVAAAAPPQLPPLAEPAATLAPGLVQLSREVLQQVEAAIEAVRSSRRPIYNVQLLKVAEKRQFNPRFEEDFVSGKDYDPDRERSERRKLQRAVKREERGAARELRRDAAFMSDVRDKEKAAKQAELYASERRAKSFLQAQESDFKSGGQGGMWKKKKKK